MTVIHLCRPPHTKKALSGQETAPIWTGVRRRRRKAVMTEIARQVTIPLGIVIRKSPGVTRWAVWSWRVVAVLPGAGPAHWREMRRDGESVEYHAATLPLELHRTQTEAYLHGISSKVPAIYVVLRARPDVQEAQGPYDVVLATASPFEAQHYADSGEEVVEKVPMPEGLAAWVRDFIKAHHAEDEFRKRRRDTVEPSTGQTGIGDPRIAQMRNVYRAPDPAHRRRVH